MAVLSINVKFTGEAISMTTTEECVYVGLLSCDVIVFDLMLNQINTITLKGLVFGFEETAPEDITIDSNNKLFICTSGSLWRALMYNSNGDIEHEYKKPNQQYRY